MVQKTRKLRFTELDELPDDLQCESCFAAGEGEGFVPLFKEAKITCVRKY